MGLRLHVERLDAIRESLQDNFEQDHMLDTCALMFALAESVLLGAGIDPNRQRMETLTDMIAYGTSEGIKQVTAYDEIAKTLADGGTP